MGQYLIDNNAISGFLAETLSANGMAVMSEAIDQTPIISVITEIEALSWVHDDKGKEQIIKSFVNDSIVISLTPEIVARCVRIRRNRKMKTPDAIIAATALVHNLTLITNDSGFDKVAGLKYLNPYLI
ncbi:MAG: type II toxin-antitoxin system VapC family toxin [Runella slithyformis]|nr:MAG: type II toxin-antitoxin system VapC family toxin [Runella slithyformis]TAE95358.1 MAG: type II toxin-antitoxin system VapC family toxin [Runella slithyformis]TAF27179.1 MAG: type II toxin-antitoxin system VapC family toxin [Runella slithyformis]TAF45828.1 MAG: type II toxin-antitoxin system VapC family toxin [Runella slithyformis]TAF78882.1 MAG: type II toxin-antitoxin system VapC family toxin [Runella slithyformis]